jgi:predicted nucleic acid-binding protein
MVMRLSPPYRPRAAIEGPLSVYSMTARTERNKATALNFAMIVTVEITRLRKYKGLASNTKQTTRMPTRFVFNISLIDAFSGRL